LFNHGIEKLFKRLAGRTDVEDALSRLDTLTREESLAVLSRNLEVTQHVDSVVRDVGDNVKTTKHGTRHSLSIFIQNIDPFSCPKSDTRELKRLSFLGTSMVDRQC